MNRQAIQARLNLYAVLQNLEELVRLDAEAAALTKHWKVSVRFRVPGGPQASLEFAEGICRHVRGCRTTPSVSLLFLSPTHLNKMFDGSGVPIPLRGWTRLGWMRRDFSRLTDRLGHYLRPNDSEAPPDEAHRRLRTILMLQTAVYAAAELAECEPTFRKIAARIPDGVLAIEVLPDGPRMQVVASGGQLRAEKLAADRPTAQMVFRNLDVAGDLLEGRLDSFRGVAEGQVIVRGLLPMLDDFGLILDRVEGYLT